MVITGERKLTERQFSYRQQQALEAAMEPELFRNITALCERIKITRSAFYKWINRDPAFREAWIEVHREAIKRQFPGVVQAMLYRGLAGDVQAAKLVAELGGYLQPESQPPSVSIQQIFNQFDLSPEQKARVLERLSPETRAMLPDVIEATAEAKESLDDGARVAGQTG